YYIDQNGQKVYTDKGGNRFATPQPTNTSVVTLQMPDGKLQGFDAQDRAGIQAALQAGAIEPQRNGIVMTTGPDGEQTISIGGASASQLTKATATDVQKDLRAVNDKIASVNQIAQNFQPYYQTGWAKLDFAWQANKEKLGYNLDDASKKELGDYTTFVASAG